MALRPDLAIGLPLSGELGLSSTKTGKANVSVEKLFCGWVSKMCLENGLPSN